MLDLHSISVRAARRECQAAYRADIPGYLACLFAGACLYLGMRFAGPVTAAMGWLP